MIDIAYAPVETVPGILQTILVCAAEVVLSGFGVWLIVKARKDRVKSETNKEN